MKPHKIAVTDFHQQVNASIAEKPRLLRGPTDTAETAAKHLRQALDKISSIQGADNELCLRLALALEELCEWVEAHAQSDLTAAADAWGDRCYVLLGDAVSAGLPVEEIFWEVHRSNMTKMGASAQTGKGIKSSDFDPPNLSTILSDDGPPT